MWRHFVAVFFRCPLRGLTFVVGMLMHAAGHAGLAMAGGALAQRLVGVGQLAPWRSIARAIVAPGAIDPVSLGAMGLAAMVVKGVGATLAVHAQGELAGELGGNVRLRVLDAWLAVHRLRRPWQSDHGVDVSDAAKVAALTTHVREVERGLDAGLLGGARAFAQLVPLVILAFAIAPRLAIAALFVFAPFGAVLGRVRRRWKAAHARAAREEEALLEAAEEAVRHADLWRTYGAERTIRAHVATAGTARAKALAGLDARATAISSANEVLGAIALVLALVAARAGWLGADAATALVPFAVTFFLAYKPLRELTDARLAWTRATAAWEQLPAAPPPPADETSEPGAAWDLDELVLEDVKIARGAGDVVDVRVAPGEIVCVQGPTGAGKTTLLRTLLGLEAAGSGCVRYAGRVLDDAPAGPRARPFAWVPQDAPLLAATLDANVSLGDGGDARTSLAEIGAEHLADVVGAAPLGGGRRALSGGERQWVALARAIATGQPVLLLDEPTSGLDAASQTRVLDAIARLRGKRTVVMVTHRPEPLAIADRVIRVGSRERSASGAVSMEA